MLELNTTRFRFSRVRSLSALVNACQRNGVLFFVFRCVFFFSSNRVPILWKVRMWMCWIMRISVWRWLELRRWSTRSLHFTASIRHTSSSHRLSCIHTYILCSCTCITWMFDVSTLLCLIFPLFRTWLPLSEGKFGCFVLIQLICLFWCEFRRGIWNNSQVNCNFQSIAWLVFYFPHRSYINCWCFFFFFLFHSHTMPNVFVCLLIVSSSSFVQRFVLVNLFRNFNAYFDVLFCFLAYDYSIVYAGKFCSLSDRISVFLIAETDGCLLISLCFDLLVD